MVSDKNRQAMCSHVCKILRQEREKRKLSMTVLGQRAGLSQQSVSYIEREMRIPNLDTLLRICGAMEIDLGDVIKRARKAVIRAG
jgi:transcriptional regulator with XRE-family HTH domain